MRNYQQKKILELVMTLNEALAEMKRLLARRDFPTVLRLLSECQEFVIQIGNYIESVAGENTRTLALLEQCHEALYQAAGEISAFNKEGPAAGGLAKRLQAIEESVRKELAPDKKEVVFLPYKAAMWDSMESIWLAASSEPCCDVYVIPIPFYDRLENGGLGQMHYEGDQYPPYVPITDWQTYDIEKNHPDIIFIHSPYDDGNTITSIHPVFYSKRLKDFTDLLAYVPYFVCEDDVQEHFCVCTGTMYAGKVFVQSEKIRQTYIRVFKEFEDKYQCHNMFGKPEEKFVAIGSPKFDKVLRSKPEDFSLPETWRGLIAKQDGTSKKTVLYNSSIDAILRGNETYLDKIESVLNAFKNREDAVLWWRPHPLNETVYRSMQPRLLARYVQIAQDYQREAYGIYDDTPDLHRALCLTDGYYGDGSSLVALYQCMGKPVMIQNSDIMSAQKRQLSLSFEKLYDDGQSLWCTAYEYNALFKLDKQTFKAEFAGSFPGEKEDAPRLYYALTGLGGRLYFGPLLARQLASYDVHQRQFAMNGIVEDRRQAEYLAKPLRIATVITAYKQFIFLAGGYPAIIRYDTATGRIDYYDGLFEKLRAALPDENAVIFRAGVVGKDPRLLIMPCLWANAAVVFDMEACISRIVEFGSGAEGFNCACFDGQDFWFARTHSPSLLQWNLETGVFREVTGFPAGFSRKLEQTHNFTEAVYAGGFVFLIPSGANMALKIDPRTGSVSHAEAFAQECSRDFHDGDFINVNYLCAYSDGQYMYAFTGKTKKLIRIDLETNDQMELAIALPRDAAAYIEPVRAAKKAVSSVRAVFAGLGACQQTTDTHYNEYEPDSLSDYITFLVHDEKALLSKAVAAMQVDWFTKTTAHSDGTSGKTIFQYCKQLTDQKE